MNCNGGWGLGVGDWRRIGCLRQLLCLLSDIGGGKEWLALLDREAIGCWLAKNYGAKPSSVSRAPRNLQTPSVWWNVAV